MEISCTRLIPCKHTCVHQFPFVHTLGQFYVNHVASPPPVSCFDLLAVKTANSESTPPSGMKMKYRSLDHLVNIQKPTVKDTKGCLTSPSRASADGGSGWQQQLQQSSSTGQCTIQSQQTTIDDWISSREPPLKATVPSTRLLVAQRVALGQVTRPFLPRTDNGFAWGGVDR